MPDWFYSQHLYYRVIIGIGITLSSAIAGKLLKSLLTSKLMHIFERTKTTLDDRMIGAIKNYILPLSVLAGLYFGVQHVRGVFEPGMVFENRMLDYINLGTYITLVLVLTSLAVSILKGLAGWYVEDLAASQEKKINPSVLPVFSKIAKIVLFFLSLLIVLDHVGVNIGGLVVSLGVGSLAVALAAQETISNLIGWFVILIDQPFRLGDTIKLPTGEEGVVHHLGLRATRILNYDNNLVMVPNGEIVKARVINLSMPETATRILVEVNVGHGTDVQKVRTIVREVFRGIPDLLSDPPPDVYLINFNETGMLLRIQGRTLLHQKFGVETKLREEVYRALVVHGITLPIPQRIVRIEKEGE